MSLTFRVADSLTGTLLGQLNPTKYDWTEPLRGQSSGTLTLPLPREAAALSRLRDLVQPRIRQVVIEENGQHVFAGPIVRPPARREPGKLMVPFVDWRHWFYRAFLRATETTRGDLITNGDQGTLAHTLLTQALNTTGAPAIAVDTAPVTGVTRDVTFRQINSSVGEFLDQLRDRNPTGLEWHTYATAGATSRLVQVRASVAWPERSTPARPLRIEYKAGRGGNVARYSWPGGEEGATRVWALGDGQPPDEVWAVAEHPSVAAGLDLAWEEVSGPHSGVVNRTTAFRHANARIASAASPAGLAEFTFTQLAVPVARLGPGDRARVIVDDGWVDVDVPAARIVSRRVEGGRDEPAVHVLTVDLADPIGPGVLLPGLPGTP